MEGNDSFILLFLLSTFGEIYAHKIREVSSVE